MKVRELVEALLEYDQEQVVVVPWSIPKTARECVEVREMEMDVTAEDDYIPTKDERVALARNRRVIALAPARREPDERKVKAAAEREQKADEAKDG